MRPLPALPARVPPDRKSGLPNAIRELLRRRVQRVSAAERPARESLSYNRQMALENRRAIRAVEPESGERRWRASGAES
jgi:hypothetical protein